MSNKHELTLADFETRDFWTWDDEADDCSFVPVIEIPFCHNREIDLGVLFIRSHCKSPDNREWNSIIGVRPSDFTVYWIHVFSDTGDFAWNLNLPCDPKDIAAFRRTFGDDLESAFPLALEQQIASLNQKLIADVPAPF